MWLEQANGWTSYRNGGTAGVSDERVLLPTSSGSMDRHEAPARGPRRRRVPARDLAAWNFAEAAAAADRLLPVAMRAAPLDHAPTSCGMGPVIAKLICGDVAGRAPGARHAGHVQHSQARRSAQPAAGCLRHLGEIQRAMAATQGRSAAVAQTSGIDRRIMSSDSPRVYTFTSTCSSYRLSFRYRVEGSMPSTSAARVLLPPSACSTHMM